MSWLRSVVLEMMCNLKNVAHYAVQQMPEGLNEV